MKLWHVELVAVILMVVGGVFGLMALKALLIVTAEFMK